jgi:hypothetical protein
VNDAASSTQLLAANTARIYAVLFNDSPAVLYLKYGATASSTDYTGAPVQPGGTHYLLGGYTGRIDGIWSYDGNGAVRITEMT